MKTFTIKGTPRVNVGKEDLLAVVKGEDMDALHAAATILFGAEYTGISIVSDDASPSFIFAVVEYPVEDAGINVPEAVEDLLTPELEEDDEPEWFGHEDAYLDSYFEDRYDFYSDEGDIYAGTYSEM